MSPEVLAVAKRAHVDLSGPLNDTLRSVSTTLELPPTNVAVVLDAVKAVPEIGVGGFTDRSGNVTISVAPTSPVGMHAALTTWVDRTVAHELDHAARILDGPGYGDTLLDVIISEGVADAFATSTVSAAGTSPWDEALTADQERAWWAAAQAVLSNRERSVHADWLFGGHGVPRWTAYTIGFHIAKGAQEHATQRSWAALTRDTSRTILSESRYGLGPA